MNTPTILVAPPANPLPYQSVEVSNYFEWKGRSGRFIAAVLLIFFAPAILLLMLLVKATSRGPAIYRQSRLGLNGEPFDILKLRTMTVDAEQNSGAVWAQPNDPRVTYLGYYLRKFHLDELPQLFNVVGGDMALVGPRPERQVFVDQLKEEVPGYLERLKVRPGVTGLAQINLPPDLETECVKKKVALDLEYIETASTSLDLRILGCTSLRLFGFSGYKAAKLCGVGRQIEDDDAEETQFASNNDTPRRAK
jgi:lipopolysaccharide/colanic/teichoic acid biosynthesis glycosyltransferase